MTVRRIVLGAHCIANPSFITIFVPPSPNQVVKPPSMYIRLLEFLNEIKIGLYQLPCPEATYMGISYGYQPKDFFENRGDFIELCEKLCNDVCNNLERIITLSERNGVSVEVKAVIGIDGSPSCACERTKRIVNGKKKYVEEMGVFMEILKEKLDEIGIRVPMIDVTKKPKLSEKKFNRL